MAFLTGLRYVMPHRLLHARGEEVADGGPDAIPRVLRALEAKVVRHHVDAAVALLHGAFEEPACMQSGPPCARGRISGRNLAAQTARSCPDEEVVGLDMRASG